MMKQNNKRTLTPKLRFPEFVDSSEWQEKLLGEISHRIIEKVGDAGLTPVSITAGRGFVSQVEKFGRDISGAQFKNYIRLRQGDFAYNKGNSKSYPQGCVSRLKEFGEAAVPSAFVSFRLRDGYVPELLEGLFEKNAHGRQLAKFITSSARSDGLLNISPDEFFSVRLPLPPTNQEQQKIAECLGSLHWLIAAEARKLTALRDHKHGLMQQLFPQPGETQPRLRFSNEGDWTMADLPAVAFFQEGPGIMAVDFRTEGVPLVRLAGVSGSVVALDGCNYLDPAKVAQKWSHFRLAVNDIIISTSATFGLSSIVTDAAAGAVFYTGLIRFRPNNKRLHRNYLKTFLESPHFKHQAESVAVGGGIKHFGPSHLKQMEIPFPPLAEQQSIADCLNALDTQITAQATKIDALTQHKRGLMQQLFPDPERFAS